MCDLERQMKSFKEALAEHIATVVEIKKNHQGYSEDSWVKLSQVK